MNKSTIPSPVYRSYKSRMASTCEESRKESYPICCFNHGDVRKGILTVDHTTIDGKEHYTTKCVIFNGKVFPTVAAFMKACRASFFPETSLETDLKLYGSFDGTTWYVLESRLAITKKDTAKGTAKGTATGNQQGPYVPPEHVFEVVPE